MANSLLTLAEAKKAIRKPAGDTRDDADIEGVYIPAVEAPIVDMIGPVITTAFTGTFDGGGSSIVLEHTDVTVTEVTVGGTALTGWMFESSAGIVYPNAHGGRFASGRQNIVIQWTAGPYANVGAVPANIKLAARIIFAHIWQADQQGPRPDVAQADDGRMYTTPSGFLIPNRAAELLGAHRLPGVA